MATEQETTDPANCRRCRRQREFFYYMRDTYKFDVDLAWDFIEAGREPVEVEDDSVNVAVDTCVIDPAHVAHVNTKFPGLIAHVEYHEEDGTIVRGHLLIDGHHRAARCLQEQKPFYAYLLTEEESAAIVVRAPYLKKPKTARTNRAAEVAPSV